MRLLSFRGLLGRWRGSHSIAGHVKVALPSARALFACGAPSPSASPMRRIAARPGDTLGYTRVSTNEQNPEAQRARLIDAGAIRVFTDVISGKRFERPGLTELIDHARPGDRLCVIRLDRLGRSLRELLETVDTLKARGIHLVSLEERFDTSSAAGEIVFHVFGAIAHFEARLISAQTARTCIYGHLEERDAVDPAASHLEMDG